MQQQIPRFGISLNNSSQGQKRAPHMGIVPQFWDRRVCSTWSYRACQSKELLHVNSSSLDLCRKCLLGAGVICLGVCLSSPILRFGSINLRQDLPALSGLYSPAAAGAEPGAAEPAHLSQWFSLHAGTRAQLPRAVRWHSDLARLSSPGLC